MPAIDDVGPLHFDHAIAFMRQHVRPKDAHELGFLKQSVAVRPSLIDSPWGHSDYHHLTAWIEASPGGFLEGEDFAICLYDCHALEYVIVRHK